MANEMGGSRDIDDGLVWRGTNSMVSLFKMKVDDETIDTFKDDGWSPWLSDVLDEIKEEEDDNVRRRILVKLAPSILAQVEMEEDEPKMLAIVMPAGSGKTTISSKIKDWVDTRWGMKVVDVDDLITKRDELKELRRKVMSGERTWSDHNHVMYKDVAENIEKVDTLLFAHGPEIISYLSEFFNVVAGIMLVPSKELHEENIREREEEHKELSRLNRSEIVGYKDAMIYEEHKFAEEMVDHWVDYEMSLYAYQNWVSLLQNVG
jgi:adenylate kinase family enzyme